MINIIYKYFFLIRNYFNNQKKKIIAIENNNKIITNCIYVYSLQILIFLNLTMIINYLNFNYIYSNDGLIYYTDLSSNNKLYISSNILENFIVNGYDITNNIKKYHINVPLYIVFNLEKIEELKNIKDIYNIEIYFTNITFQKKKKIYNNYDQIKYCILSDLIK
jgi:hypothetical protein